ncbi:MAG: hypothetical protein ACFCA4_07775 [Cyanophyceae cyanobacterium]|mgnify:FL=1
MNRDNQNPKKNESISNRNSESLPFGSFEDLPDLAKTTHQDDRDLVTFLRQYRPEPPPEPANFEANLIRVIAQEPTPASTVVNNPKKAKRWPRIIGAIAAGVVGAGLGHTFGALTSPSGMGAQFADADSDGNFDSNSGANVGRETELETFLENSWDGAIAQTTSTDTSDSSDFSPFYWDTSGM